MVSKVLLRQDAQYLLDMAIVLRLLNAKCISNIDKYNICSMQEKKLWRTDIIRLARDWQKSHKKVGI
jgi:hypothetical protein